MKIGFTGTREQITHHQKRALFERFERLQGKAQELHHGCCLGADTEFHLFARMLLKAPRAFIIGHPPTDHRYLSKVVNSCDGLAAEAPYLDRNKAIVASTDCLIAMPRNAEELRSGTWSTVRYARSLGKPILIIYPDGHVETEGRRLTVQTS